MATIWIVSHRDPYFAEGLDCDAGCLIQPKEIMAVCDTREIAEKEIDSILARISYNRKDFEIKEWVVKPMSEGLGRQYHQGNCTSAIINPLTEWVGGGLIRISGYRCPECAKVTPIEDV